MAFLKIAAISIFWASVIAGSDAGELSGKVTRVIDGDDIELCTDGGKCVRIRLCGIDAPEQRCSGYAEARAALRGIAEGKEARCIPVGDGTPCDGKSKPTNRERIVAQCFVEGTDVAGALVTQGLVCDWRRFSGGYYSTGGKGRECPRNHRSICAAVLPPAKSGT
jgi:endonuclease YncB( thermonuclease family)